MRILQVVTQVDRTGTFGGPTSVALQQAKLLQKAGHQVVLAGGWGDPTRPPAEFGGIPSNLFRMRRLMPGAQFTGLMSLRMIEWAHRRLSEFDIVHVHAGRHLAPMVLAAQARRQNVPLVVQTHGMLPPSDRQTVRAFDRVLIRPLRDTTFLALTLREARELHEEFGSRFSIEHVFNTIEVLKPNDIPSSTTAPPELLYIGRLAARKRLVELIHAAQILRDEGVKFQLAICGPDEGERPRLEDEIRRRGLTDIVRIRGPVQRERVQERMCSAVLFVLPSVGEPFPMALLEALSVGLPAIVTTGCDLAPDLSAAGAATVVDPDAASIAAAARRLLGSADRRRQQAERGRYYLRTHLSGDALVRRLEHIYAVANASTRL